MVYFANASNQFRFDTLFKLQSSDEIFESDNYKRTFKVRSLVVGVMDSGSF